MNDESWLWHKRYRHLNLQSLRSLHQKNMVYSLLAIQDKKETYEGCALGKQHREVFSKEHAWRAKASLELIHIDICRPMKTLSHISNIYFITFIDDYSKMTWVYFMRYKSEVFTIFKKFKNLVERQSEHYIKMLRSDRGGEYNLNKFEKFMKMLVCKNN